MQLYSKILGKKIHKDLYQIVLNLRINCQNITVYRILIQNDIFKVQEQENISEKWDQYKVIYKLILLDFERRNYIRKAN